MRLDGELEQLATDQHACVSTWQLRDLSATPKEITRLRRSRGWMELSRRVLIRAGAPRTPLQIACAAVLEAGRNAALVPHSAAALWGLGQFYKLLPACVMTDRDVASFGGEVGHIFQRRGIPDRWITTYQGIRIVRPELCIYQLCGLVNPKRAERALDTGLSMRLVTVGSMRACLEELRRSGRNGTTVLA